MFDQLRVWRGFALVVVLLSACGGGAQAPATPAPVSASPAPTAVLSAPPATAAQQPSPQPTASIPTTAPSLPSPSPLPPSPPPTALDVQSSVSCIPSGTPLPGLPTVSEIAPEHDTNRTAPAAPPVAGYEVIQAYPHDPRAWTEGLIFVDGVLYEGTGREHGPATLSKLDLATGAVLQRCALPLDFYGEGVTIFGDAIYQLTWQIASPKIVTPSP